MASFIRALRSHSSNSPRHRHSTASTVTQGSSKTDHHSSISIVAKRAFSVFDSRSSWTTSTMTEDLKPLITTIAPSISPISENRSTGASTNSGDGEKRVRKITPKIQALKALFEFRHTALEKENCRESITEHNKENIEDRRTLDERQISSPIKETGCFEDIKPANETQPIISARNSNERVSTHSTISSPLKARSHNILKSVPSLADLRNRRRVMKEDRKRPVSDNTSKFPDAKQSRAWQEKVNVLAEYCNTLAIGNVPEIISTVLDRTKLFEVEEDVMSNSPNFHLLTPDEDLAQCVNSNSCHPHRVPYFAKVLCEAKQAIENGIKEKHDWAKEAALYLVYHPCRVPLVFRIEAVHLLIKINWPPDNATLLKLAWKWCHELETTAMMVGLIHTTQQMWHDSFGDLNDMPDLLYAPPKDGYWVRDMDRCQ